MKIIIIKINKKDYILQIKQQIVEKKNNGE